MDLHALLELVDRGCPPRLAVRILAPITRPEYSEPRRRSTQASIQEVVVTTN